MRYLDTFAGIGSASVAWEPLGWQAVANAENAPFQCAVLKHHYPNVPNLGDCNHFKGWPDLGTVDLVCGGTPCQSFSIAGLRAGLADPRGQLTLTFLAIVDQFRPRWVVWENTLGVLSDDGGRSFAAILGALGVLGYGWSYRVLDAEYVRVGGFPRAVPQRRRRVFLVGYSLDWRRAAAVFFEPKSLLGDYPPRRASGKAAASDVAPGLVGSGRGVQRTGESRGQDPLVATEVSGTVSSKWHKGTGGPAGDEAYNLVAHTMPVDDDPDEPLLIPFDTTQITSDKNYSNPVNGDPCHPLAATAHPPAVAFQPRVARNDRGDASDVAHSLTSEPGSTGRGDSAECVAIDLRNGTVDGDVAMTLQGGGMGDERGRSINSIPHVMKWAVRRLMPVECERLMGLPDGWTDIPWRGKAHAPDGPRYKALGNAWAVNSARWIGERIALVDRVFGEAGQ